MPPGTGCERTAGEELRVVSGRLAVVDAVIVTVDICDRLVLLDEVGELRDTHCSAAACTVMLLDWRPTGTAGMVCTARTMATAESMSRNMTRCIGAWSLYRNTSGTHAFRAHAKCLQSRVL